MLAAAGLGAAYAAPYLGRLDDAGQDGPARSSAPCTTSCAVPERKRASWSPACATAQEVVDLAAAGLDTFTFGPDVAEQLLAAESDHRRGRCGFPAGGRSHGGQDS